MAFEITDSDYVFTRILVFTTTVSTGLLRSWFSADRSGGRRLVLDGPSPNTPSCREPGIVALTTHSEICRLTVYG